MTTLCDAAEKMVSDMNGWPSSFVDICDRQAELELDQVLDYLRRHERDQVLGLPAPSIGELISALERGEHHR